MSKHHSARQKRRRAKVRKARHWRARTKRGMRGASVVTLTGVLVGWRFVGQSFSSYVVMR